MKITEAIKNHRGQPFEIPDCGRNDLPKAFKEMGFKVGAEIGTYKGEYTEEFLKEGLKMYAVDPWKAYGNYNDRNYPGGFQKRQDFLYEHTKRVFEPYGDLAVIVRKTSMDAVKDFEDESLDFVYIDGHHGFRYVAEDLYEWPLKVKKGGIIAGHDYALNKKGARDPNVLHVKYVLHAYVKAFGITNWYVLGRKNPPGERVRPGVIAHNGIEEKRDKWRSWMWVKE